MPQNDPIDDLLLQLLERPEEQWEGGVTELCATRGDCATEIRRRFDLLRSSGFLITERAPPPPVFPERLGEFQLVELIGQGGMGVVYKALEERLGRTVALKLVRPEYLYFKGSRERFQREITAVARLSHPGIVSVLTVGDERGMPYFTMELLRGASLDEVLRALAGRQVEALTGADLAAVVAAGAGVATRVGDAQLHDELFTGPWTNVCAVIARRVAEALAHAHQNDVVHRDVKPSNVIVTPEGRVVLLDFGLARPAGTDRMTRDGSHVGSLPYMAPEQLRGEVGDARTDVYGLGVMLRELLTLRQPFLSPSSETTRQRILHGDGASVALGNRAASWELATVCAMATEPDPRRRYAAAADCARDLDNVLHRRPIMAQPAGTMRRMLRWAQRRPTLTTGLLVGLLAAIGTPSAIAIGIAGQRDLARAAEVAQQQMTYEANLAAANSALLTHDAAEVRRRLDACPASLRGFEWRHLDLARDGSLLVLRGHHDPVTAVAMTADARLLASGSQGGDVLLWDIAHGELIHRFTHHRALVRQLAFSADGEHLLIHDSPGHTSVVEVATRTILAERQRSSVNDEVVIGADARCVFASQGGWRILELDPLTLATRREIALQQVGHPPNQLMLSDGRRLASVSKSALHIWDLSTGRLTTTVPSLLTSGLRSLSMSVDGDRIAAGDSEGRTVIVEAADGHLVQVLSNHGGIRHVTFDRSGGRLVAVGADGALCASEIETGRLLSVQAGHDGPINSVAFSGSRMLIATASHDHTVRLWSPFGGRDHQALRGHVGAVTRLSVLAGDKRLVSSSEDGSLRFWDVTTGMPLATCTGYMHHVNTLAVAADGSKAYTTFNGMVVTTDLRTMASAQAVATGQRRILDLAAAPSGGLLLAATTEGCVLLDPKDHRVVRAVPGDPGMVMACAFGALGRVAFLGLFDGRVMRWDLDSDRVTVVVACTAPIAGLAVAPDGSLLAAAGRSEGAPQTPCTLWRCAAGSSNLVWQRTCSSAPRAVVVLADGSRVVTGHDDGTVVFWDTVTGAAVLTRRLGEVAIRALACDPGGEFIVAGSGDGTCYLLRATAAVAVADVLRIAGTSTAMRLHTQQRRELRTHEEMMALIDTQPGLDPALRDWMRSCELCWLVMPWSTAQSACEVVLQPGLPAARYLAARRVAETAGVSDTGRKAIDALQLRAVAIDVMASARLGDAARSLSAGAVFTEQQLAETGAYYEPILRAGRAMALHATGQDEAAARDLERLATLAAEPEALSHAVSLWREVEALLAK